MRVTNNMMVANTVWNINKNMERLNKASQVAATQAKIQLPSDDPLVATRAIKYRSYVAAVEQYQKNVDSAVSWQEVTHSALDGLTDVVQRLQELVTQASSSGTLTDSDLADIKSEVSQLQQTAVDYLNTSYAGRYVFAGYDTNAAPYAVESTAVGNQVTYKGQYLTMVADSASYAASDIQTFYQEQVNNNKLYTDNGDDQSIQYNVGFGSSLAVNVEGQDVTGSGAGNLFDTIAKILIGLDGGANYTTVTAAGSAVSPTTTAFAMTDLLDDLADNLNTILTAQTDLGARMNYASMAQDRLASNAETYTKLMSNNEDADIALATTDLTTAQSVYNASLSVGSIVMSKSLVDFLR